LPSPEAGAPAYRASDGAAYDWFLGRWTQRLAEPFIDFAKMPADGAVLEVGCGTGSLVGRIASRVPERAVVGTDLSLPYLVQARSNAPQGAYVVSDARKLAFRDGTFAASLAQLVLNFVPDPAAAVAEMKRVTRPGGVVAASVWDFRGGLVYQRVFWDTASGIDPAAGAARDRLFATPLATAAGLTALMTKSGLDEVTTGSLTIRMDYDSFDDYWQPLLGGQGPVGTYAAGLPEERRALVRERVRLAYLAGGADGPRSMTATAWAVRGRVP
jgi:SAM-dependent methyltransferase